MLNRKRKATVTDEEAITAINLLIEAGYLDNVPVFKVVTKGEPPNVTVDKVVPLVPGEYVVPGKPHVEGIRPTAELLNISRAVIYDEGFSTPAPPRIVAEGDMRQVRRTADEVREAVQSGEPTAPLLPVYWVNVSGTVYVEADSEEEASDKAHEFVGGLVASTGYPRLNYLSAEGELARRVGEGEPA